MPISQAAGKEQLYQTPKIVLPKSNFFTVFQSLTNTDFFHTNPVLPFRNVPDAASKHTITKQKQILLVGELCRGHLFYSQLLSNTHYIWEPFYRNNWLCCLQLSGEYNYTTSSTTFKHLKSQHFLFYLQQIFPSGNLSPFSIIRYSVQMETSCLLTSLPRTDSFTPLQSFLKLLEHRRSSVELFNSTKGVHIQKDSLYKQPSKAKCEECVVIKYDTVMYQHLSPEIYSQSFI